MLGYIMLKAGGRAWRESLVACSHVCHQDSGRAGFSGCAQTLDRRRPNRPISLADHPCEKCGLEPERQLLLSASLLPFVPPARRVRNGATAAIDSPLGVDFGSSRTALRTVAVASMCDPGGALLDILPMSRRWKASCREVKRLRLVLLLLLPASQNHLKPLIS